MSSTIIAAVSENYLIGKNEMVDEVEKFSMPWPWIKGDMLHFQKLTKGNNVIIGRKTAESIDEKYFPFSERKNILVTREDNPFYGGIHEDVPLIKSFEDASRIDSKSERGFDDKVIYRANSIDEAVKFCSSKKDIYVSGGGDIYQQFLDKGLVDKMEITWIHKEYQENENSVRFANLDWGLWEKINSESHRDEKNGLDYTFATYTIKRVA